MLDPRQVHGFQRKIIINAHGTVLNGDGKWQLLWTSGSVDIDLQGSPEAPATFVNGSANDRSHGRAAT